MATLSFSYDTGNVALSRIVNGMATTYGYQAMVPDPQNPGQMIPNPQSKADFGRQEIRRIIVEAVRNAEAQDARIAAEAAVTNITLT